MVLLGGADVGERLAHLFGSQNSVGDGPGSDTRDHIGPWEFPGCGLGEPKRDLGTEFRIGKDPPVVTVYRGMPA